VRDQAANTLMQSVANAIAKNADDNDDDDDKGASNRTSPAGAKPSSDDR